MGTIKTEQQENPETNKTDIETVNETTEKAVECDNKNSNSVFIGVLNKIAKPSDRLKGYYYTILMTVGVYILWFAVLLFQTGFDNLGLSSDVAELSKGESVFRIISGIILLICAIADEMYILSFMKQGSGDGVNRYVFTAVLAVNSALLPEFIMDSTVLKSNLLYNILGIMLCYTLYLVGSAIFQKPKIYYGIISGIFSIYGFLQYYIVVFRGAPIQFSDLFNLSSAKEAEDMYHFSFSLYPAFAVVNLAVLILLLVKVRISPVKVKTRLLSGGGVIACVAIMIFAGKFSFDLGVKNRYILMNFSGAQNIETYSNVGYNLMFCFDGMYNRVEKPQGYSDEKAEEILGEYSFEKADKKPTIIAIMNESFADFSHIADFNTNKDYMPNYHSLKNEAVTGYVTVSAYGGYSCNSEYEFLSGNTLGFLPAGSAVFTEYLETKQDSLVSYLKSQGYNTLALTPCSSGLWEVGTAYENLQFDKSQFECENEAPLKETINGNVSDASTFSSIEQAVGNNNSGKPMFIWTTTMQNHGPYDCEKRDTTPENISLCDIDNSEAQLYLDSIYMSDKALGDMIDYFRKVDDEVIIVMFGDHYPHIIDFTEKLYGQDIATLSTEDYARLHQTPFLIWDNKGTDAKSIDEISLNYLSNEVMKVADIPLAPYQQELEKIREKLPVISMFGYMNSNGDWFEINSCDDVTDDMRNEYNIMQYYRMFSCKNND